MRYIDYFFKHSISILCSIMSFIVANFSHFCPYLLHLGTIKFNFEWNNLKNYFECTLFVALFDFEVTFCKYYHR